MARFFTLLILLIILILGVTFALQNANAVIIHYYVGSSEIPLSLLLVLVLGIGGVIGWLTGLWVWCRLKAENIKLTHRLKMVDKELHQLRTQPIHET